MSRLSAELVRERVRGTILERIGDTPLIPLHRVGAGLRGDLWAKIERKRIARAFGAQLVLTDPLEGTDGAIREAQRRASADADRYVYVDQYSNPANPLSHELGTAAEIWKQTGGRVTHFVAGVGT